MNYTIQIRTVQQQEKLQKVHPEVQSQTPTGLSSSSHVYRCLSTDGGKRIQLVTKRDNTRRMFQMQKKREVSSARLEVSPCTSLRRLALESDDLSRSALRATTFPCMEN
jgi:hypothetical protein